MMTAAHATAVVVDLGDGSLGILTDRDLRTRVVARRPRRRRRRFGGDVRARLHVRARPARRRRPARDARPRLPPLPGRVGDRDDPRRDRGPRPGRRRRRAPRSTCAGGSRGAQTVDELVAAAPRAAPDGDRAARRPRRRDQHRRPSTRSSSTRSRAALLELDGRATPASRASTFAWLALGSQARREALPSSDIDSAIVWFGDADEDDGPNRALHAIGPPWSSATRGAAGCDADEHGATRVRSAVRALASSPGSAPRAAGSTTRRRRRR